MGSLVGGICNIRQSLLAFPGLKFSRRRIARRAPLLCGRFLLELLVFLLVFLVAFFPLDLRFLASFYNTNMPLKLQQLIY